RLRAYACASVCGFTGTEHAKQLTNDKTWSVYIAGQTRTTFACGCACLYGADVATRPTYEEPSLCRPGTKNVKFPGPRGPSKNLRASMGECCFLRVFDHLRPSTTVAAAHHKARIERELEVVARPEEFSV
ncbi:unnamed protein product, partial [Ectocarpus sp. 4 AP-2014]